MTALIQRKIYKNGENFASSCGKTAQIPHVYKHLLFSEVVNQDLKSDRNVLESGINMIQIKQFWIKISDIKIIFQPFRSLRVLRV